MRGRSGKHTIYTTTVLRRSQTNPSVMLLVGRQSLYSKVVCNLNRKFGQVQNTRHQGHDTKTCIGTLSEHSHTYIFFFFETKLFTGRQACRQSPHFCRKGCSEGKLQFVRCSMWATHIFIQTAHQCNVGSEFSKHEKSMTFCNLTNAWIPQKTAQEWPCICDTKVALGTRHFWFHFGTKT